MLEVNIKKRFSDFLLDVQFETGKGVLGILGASGCGKSLTLKSIAGVTVPDEGIIKLNDRLLFDSKNNLNLKPQKRNAGYLFQEYALFPNMTVFENIGAGLSKKKYSRNDRTHRIETFIRRFLLEGLESRYPSNLSGGQRQRVALARMMAHEPQILLLDEPFSALDIYLKEELQIQLLDILKEFDGISILVTHDRDEAYKLSENLIIIDNGSVCECSETKVLFSRPQTYQAARLTGCKNISKAVKTGSHSVMAMDWNVVLQTAEPVSNNIRAVGVRARDFIPFPNNRDGMVNLIPVKFDAIVEEAFEFNILMRLVKNQNTSNDQHKIWCSANKTDNATKLFFDSEYVMIPPEKVLLLK